MYSNQIPTTVGQTHIPPEQTRFVSCPVVELYKHMSFLPTKQAPPYVTLGLHALIFLFLFFYKINNLNRNKTNIMLIVL